MKFAAAEAWQQAVKNERVQPEFDDLCEQISGCSPVDTPGIPPVTTRRYAVKGNAMAGTVGLEIAVSLIVLRSPILK